MAEYRDLGQVSKPPNLKDPRRIGSGTGIDIFNLFCRQGELRINYFEFKMKKSKLIKLCSVSFVKKNSIRKPGSGFRFDKKRPLKKFY